MGALPRSPQLFEAIKVVFKLECTTVVQTLIFPIVHHELISVEDASFMNKVFQKLVGIGTDISGMLDITEGP